MSRRRDGGMATAELAVVLPTLVLASMQNLSDDEQAALATQLKVLADSKLEDWAKTLTLGLTLEALVGRSVLRAAVDTVHAPGEHSRAKSASLSTAYFERSPSCSK